MKLAIAISGTLKRKTIAYPRCSLLAYHAEGRGYHATPYRSRPSLEPRLEDHGRVIHDEYSIVRDKYDVPKHPIVLAHGLLGFDELRLGGPYLPGVQYWRGIREALTARGIEVITATVPPSGSIEDRAKELARDIEAGARGKDVNIIAYVAVVFSNVLTRSNLLAGIAWGKLAFQKILRRELIRIKWP
ncbi:hypothetical protein N7541_010978 [Penicillium brevicompactum]|uniref:Triacylglycerol lipase n=1 Tax=Penicillium brevicompactum TaxID=5074 RepID=A0A9W9UIQ4_PENBR|nr:hypothetical protein N7541_010978 [Penicillium brevicompactum]